VRLVVIRWGVAAIALAVACLYLGRRLTLLLDRLLLARIRTPTVDRVLYDGGLRIGELDLTFGATNNLRYPLELCTDASFHVVLEAGGKNFTLGPRLNPIDPKGRVETDFKPDPGDEVTLKAGQSWLPWPTPFEYQFMSAHSPRWKRYVYYSLLWKKRNGARLGMRWRYQQDYTAGEWGRPLMMWNGQTGLLRVEIQ